jgi:phosphoglycerate dehydrogenase-like enzyme
MRMSNRVAVAADMIHRNDFMRHAVLAAYPDAKLHEGPRMNEDELIAFLRGHVAAIIGFEPITERVLSALPDLKVISKFGAGCETIDFHAMRRHGVRFGYEWGVNKLAVAELALCFMIAGLRWLMPLNLSMRAAERPGIRNGRLLTGRTVGIHGCGNIGKEVVRLLQPFGCKILACDIQDYPKFYRDHGVTPVSFERLLERSEVLTLHLPKTKATLGLYTRDALTKLRPDCLLINTCRGGIVDEDALAERLESGALRAACFDVFAVEPAGNDRLLRNPNMLATPHIGASAEEIRVKMIQAAIDGITSNELVEPARFYA